MVDDEPAVGRALCRLLMVAGYEAELCLSGNSLFRLLERRQPSCVPLDQNMPRMDGFEVLARLASFGTPPPVIVMTGYGSEAGRLLATASGVRDYLRKPIDATRLLAAIQRAILPPGNPKSP